MVLLKNVAVLVSLAVFNTCNGANEGDIVAAIPGHQAHAKVRDAGHLAKLPAIPEVAPDPGHIIPKVKVHKSPYNDDREHTMKYIDSTDLPPPEEQHAHIQRDVDGDKTLTVRDIIENGFNGALTERDAYPFVQAIGNVLASFGKRGNPEDPTANKEAQPAAAAGAESAAEALAQAPASGDHATADDALKASSAGGAASAASGKEAGADVGYVTDQLKAATLQGKHQYSVDSKESHKQELDLEGTHTGGRRKGTKYLASHRKGISGRIPKSGTVLAKSQSDEPASDTPPTERMSFRRGHRRRQVPPVRPYLQDNGQSPFGTRQRLASMQNVADTTYDYRPMRRPSRQPSPLQYQKAPDGNAFKPNSFPTQRKAEFVNDEAPLPKRPTDGARTLGGAQGKYEGKAAAKENHSKGKASEEEDPEVEEVEAEQSASPKKLGSKSKSKSMTKSVSWHKSVDGAEDEKDEPPKSKHAASNSAPKYKSYKDKAPSHDAYDSDDFDAQDAGRHSSQFHIKHEMVQQKQNRESN